MTTLPPDPYLTLGLPRDADQATIKSTYRKLVLKCHPDKVTDESLKAESAEQFHKVQRAYETIGDEVNRAKYDGAYKLEKLREEQIKKRKQSGTEDRFEVPTRNNGLYPRRARRQRVDTLEGLRGFVNGKYVVTLCDTGADENFIAEDAAKELGLDITYLWDNNRPSFIMGHGRPIFAIGSIKATWKFENGGSSVHDVTFYVLKDCIFDVMIGSKFLNKTETMTEHRYRLCRIPKPGRALRTRVVNLCGTPSRRIRGSLKEEECDALPDSGAEPNLLSYEYVEKRNWLLDMFPPPQSCQLLQFADGSTETVSGRLRLQWSFVKGWGIAPPDADDYVDFDVLRGCPFDVILGCDFLFDTDAFVAHQDSFQEIIQEGPSGLNIVMWVTDKKKKKTQRDREKRDAVQDEVDRELNRRANAEDDRRRGDARLRADELKRENERRNRWETDHPGRGYDRTFSSTNARRRSPSPIRRPSQRTNPPTIPRSYDTHWPDEPPRHPAAPHMSPSPLGVRRRQTPPIQTTGPRATERTERTKYYYPQPPLQSPNQYAGYSPPRTNTKSSDIPYPSLSSAKDQTRAANPDRYYTPSSARKMPRASRPPSGLLVDELDMYYQDTNQSHTNSSPNRIDSSTSNRPGRQRSYSESSLPRAEGKKSYIPFPEDSIEDPRAQQTPIQIRTSDANARATPGAKRTVNREVEQPLFATSRSRRISPASLRPPPSRSPPPPRSSYLAPNPSKPAMPSRMKSRERSFDSTGSDSTLDSRSTPSTTSTARTSVEEAEREKPRLRRRDRFRV